jgi:uncharacterized membrane protein YphA (DoxX/SURF4 family)
MSSIKRWNATTAGRAVVLIRILVGWVFVLEGIGKFLYPAEQGIGRFEKIPGIPFPDVTAPFVGGVEVVFGTLILLGLFTRMAAIPLLIDISVAILSTKVPILFGHSYGIPALKHYNLWGMLHETRTDLSMWLGLAYLLIVGAGRWSFDARPRKAAAQKTYQARE